MFSIVIADDESAIRNGLARHIDWADMGFSVAGTFEDGSDLIDYLKRDSVDVVLTDIRMSSVSGLEVARYVRKHHPRTRVVIVSAHRDFDYAREAMRHGVRHYLLKPTLPEEVAETFGALSRELRAASEKRPVPIVEDVRKCREILLYELLAGAHGSAREFSRRWEQCLLPHPRDAESISHLRLPAEDLDRANYARELAAPEAMGITVAIADEGTEYVHLLVVRDAPSAPSVENVAHTIAGETRQVAITTRKPDAPVWTFMRGGPAPASEADQIARLRRLFHDEDESLRAFRRFFAVAASDYPNVEALRRLAVRCVRSLLHRPAARPDYHSIFVATDRDSIAVATHTALARSARQSASHDSLLVRLDRYLDSRLAEDLSLTTVAYEFHFSPTHFSRLVKRLSGITYGTYVRNRRLQRARETLLDSSTSIKDVASSVGYSDSRYFNRQFRSETGMTPTEFRHSTRGPSE